MIKNAVAMEAMMLLTIRINVATGLTHSSDKSTTVGLFRALIAAGEDYEPDELKEWAHMNGWSDQGAKRLWEIAVAVRGGRVLKANSHGGWKPDIVERLREKARSR